MNSGLILIYSTLTYEISETIFDVGFTWFNLKLAEFDFVQFGYMYIQIFTIVFALQLKIFKENCNVLFVHK